MKHLFLWLLIVCLSPLPMSADPIYLVKDIETEGIPFQVPTPFPLIIEAFGGLPFGLTAVGDQLVFLANDRIHGFEPWVSNGTEAGTMLLRETCPGDCGAAFQSWRPSQRNLVFFAGNTEEGQAYWMSDGTTAGTEQLVPQSTFLDYPSEVVFLGNTPYALVENELISPAGAGQPPESIEGFCDDLPSHPCETRLQQEGNILYVAEWVQLAVSQRIVRIWANDGTAGSSVLLAEAPARDLRDLRAFPLPDGNSLVAASYDFVGGGDKAVLLVHTDGTTAGTEIVDTDSISMRQLAADPVVRDGIPYLVDEGGSLWRLQGTTLDLVVQLPGTPGDLRSLRGGLVVTLSTTLVFQHEVWSIDLQKGTGHRIPENFDVWHFAHPPDMAPEPHVSVLADWNGLLFFPGSGRGTGEELWVTDGTSAGTRVVEDLVPGVASSYPTQLVVAGDHLYFSAVTPELDRELFAVDLPDLACSPTGALTPGRSTNCSGETLGKGGSQPSKQRP